MPTPLFNLVLSPSVMDISEHHPVLTALNVIHIHVYQQSSSIAALTTLTTVKSSSYLTPLMINHHSFLETFLIHT